MSTTEVDLVNVVREALRQKGVLSDLKARVRAEVFNLLEDKTVSMPKRQSELFLVTELIREFLASMKYDNTLAVFEEEVGGGMADEQISREFLGSELGFNTLLADQSVPLLLMLVHKFIEDKKTLDSNVGKNEIS